MQTRKPKIEELEQRIAPSVVGNPSQNNTNNPGNEGGGGTNPVPAGATPQPAGNG
jgi:hypothetical protein